MRQCGSILDKNIRGDGAILSQFVTITSNATVALFYTLMPVRMWHMIL